MLLYVNIASIGEVLSCPQPIGSQRRYTTRKPHNAFGPFYDAGKPSDASLSFSDACTQNHTVNRVEYQGFKKQFHAVQPVLMPSHPVKPNMGDTQLELAFEKIQAQGDGNGKIRDEAPRTFSRRRLQSSRLSRMTKCQARLHLTTRATLQASVYIPGTC